MYIYIEGTKIRQGKLNKIGFARVTDPLEMFIH